MHRNAIHSYPKRFGHLLAATALLVASAFLAIAQANVPVTDLKVGDWAEVLFGEWTPVTIAAPLSLGAYQVNVGAMVVSVAAYSSKIRHYTPTAADLAVQHETAIAMQNRPKGPIGAKFGTREPATCPNRKNPPSAVTAKQYFICDWEATVLPLQISLVSDVTIELGAARPFNYNQDSASTGIDVRSVVYDARGKYTSYQCIPQSAALNDFANAHNCNKYPYTTAQGRCYKDTFGDWHCWMGGGAGGGQVTNQMPPAGF
ncbi:MAG TPA: hypothetical protein VIL39_07355 [Verrucomicrobiae bacterium]